MKSFTDVAAGHLKQIVFLKLLEHTSFQLHKLTNTDTHTDIQTDRHTHVQSYIHIYTAANVAGFPLFCRSPIKGLFKYLSNICCLSNAMYSSIGQNIKPLACPMSDVRCPMSDV